MNFKGKLALQQRVLPGYRVPFFDLLASHCEGGMSLFAGKARPEEMIAGGTTHVAKHVEAENIHLFNGAFYLCHQKGFVDWLENWDPDALIVEANKFIQEDVPNLNKQIAESGVAPIKAGEPLAPLQQR